MKKECVLAFDFGFGSLGSAVRINDQIVDAQSATYATDYGSLAFSGTKRRMYRTRQSHKAREIWLNHIMDQIGISPLKTFHVQKQKIKIKEVDNKLKKEFPSKKEKNTIYNGALLRIHILEGKINQLEPWQIYKALHSAIQKRGYEDSVAWQTATDSEKAKETKVTAARMNRFKEFCHQNFQGKAPSYPCYFEAFQLGLWNPLSDDDTKLRISHLARPFSLDSHDKDDTTKGYTAPRECVEEEVTNLLRQIQKRYPALDVDYALYGSIKKQDGYYKKPPSQKISEITGFSVEQEGLLSQKMPRFDNRSVNDCVLMPGRKVGRAKDNLLNKQFVFLSKLHHMRIIDNATGELRPFTHVEYLNIWNDCLALKDFSYKLGIRQLSKILNKYSLEPNGKEQNKIEPAKEDGRTRFCKPALFFLKEYYLQGKSPEEFKNWALDQPSSPHSTIKIKENQDLLKGLTSKDFRWLDSLIQKEIPWNKFYIASINDLPDDAKQTPRDQAIKNYIAKCTSSQIRERLKMFHSHLKDIEKNLLANHQIQEPDHIVLEFVRDDFMGEKAKKQFRAAQKQNEDFNKKAKKAIESNGLGLTGKNIKIFKLLEKQGFKDLYAIALGLPDSNLSSVDLSQHDLDHIVPRSMGGSDAQYNLIVCDRDLNKAKGNKTPYDWFGADPKKWDRFVQAVNATNLTSRQKELLLSPQPLELIQRWEALHITSWIAKLAQNLVYIFYNWTPLNQGQNEKRKVYVIHGSQTHTLRKLLSEDKNRDDFRHHALDAMLMTLYRFYLKDIQKNTYQFKRKKELTEDQKTFAQNVRKSMEDMYQKLLPIKLGKDRAILEENFYAQHIESLDNPKQNKEFIQKQESKRFYFTKRFSLQSLAYKTVNQKVVFDLKTLSKVTPNIYGGQNEIIPKLQAIIKTIEPLDKKEQETIYLKECANFHLSNGTRLKKVRMLDTKYTVDENGYYEQKILSATSETGVQVLKPKGTHKYQWILQDTNSKKYFVRPAYAHESDQTVEDWVKTNNHKKILKVRSGSILKFHEDLHGTRKAKDKINPKGLYVLNSMMKSGQFKLKNIDGTAPSFETPNIQMVLNQMQLSVHRY